MGKAAANYSAAAVIHNAGISYREPKLVKTVDGLPQLFAVNTLAPYILTALITMPNGWCTLSSGMHYGAGSYLDTARAVEQLRLEAARFMMEEGRHSVNVVAQEETGFADRERMGRAFLRTFGAPPEDCAGT
jgi:AraC-like DNA-binding protein